MQPHSASISTQRSKSKAPFVAVSRAHICASRLPRAEVGRVGNILPRLYTDFMKGNKSLAQHSAVQHLIEANNNMQIATKTYDVASLEKMITDDFELFSSSGKIYDRAAFLRDVGDTSVKWEKNDPEDVAVRLYNDDSAMVTAVLHMRYVVGERLVDTRIRYGDMWVKIDGTWLYASGHACPMK